MNQSIIRDLGPVSFPAFTGERVYMVPFLKAEGLPQHLARWQPTIDSMIASVETEQPIYLMVDQAVVKPGDTHRRPGLHIDGYWHSQLNAHSGEPRGHGAYAPPIKQDPPRMKEPMPQRIKKKSPAKKKPPAKKAGSLWDHVNLNDPEAIIIASNVQACLASVGDWDGEILEGGDCSRIDLSYLEPQWLYANRAYAGNVSMLHESTPLQFLTHRTLVRLNVPGWSLT